MNKYCNYCDSISIDDYRGNCSCCGAPRDKKRPLSSEEVMALYPPATPEQVYNKTAEQAKELYYSSVYNNNLDIRIVDAIEEKTSAIKKAWECLTIRSERIMR